MTRFVHRAAGLALFLVPTSVSAQAAPAAGAVTPATPAAAATIKRITASPGYAKAVAALDAGHDRWVQNIITLTEIPAPPFKEAVRARAYRDMFTAARLTDVEIDEEGNVLGLRKGGGEGLIVVSAHMDTVFPEGTPVKVRREGDRLYAPGVGDDTTGLATQLAIIEAMNAAGIKTKADILFVGTVGEEGLGDLRGVRYLFTKGKYKDKAKAFFSLDGGGLDGVTVGGAGSKRYRVMFKGPGGHSYGAFGLVNPMTAMSQAVVDFYKIAVPADPKTTYSASVVSGGTSVNAIPREVTMEFDMRSESAESLANVEKQFLATLQKAAATENAARSTKEGAITAEPKLIGDRPAGQTPRDAEIVQYATAAYAAEGIPIRYGAGSTDSNIPISLGIPAITISRVATSGRGHSLDEWISVEKPGNLQVKRLGLAMILATAGM
ncbi:M20/M25/M40 family metallo-hydrolase [Sphingomonas radiodurans]|uniref:M20/M25/M40 family metallo-hydrolase n=1 Tax=Sphingomonas radiodurans TaxID=2890321 RepID=UPI001E471F18|nr:M20/M25/M40 family metallo-hydrolase [Sphingomonas radiodurans]WBH17418.1 M20/M25/M40 family metallo-hydrolase [Sphingomonas radiodurans]